MTTTEINNKNKKPKKMKSTNVQKESTKLKKQILETPLMKNCYFLW